MSGEVHPFTVPKWGLSMEDARVVQWHVAEGAAVGVGDELLDIETSKIANGVESPVAGILRRIVAHPEETVFLGQLLGVIAGAEVDDATIDAFVHEFQKSFVRPEHTEGKETVTLTVEAAGQRIGYIVAGPEDAEAIPALLIHGFGGDCSNWMFNLSALGKDRRVFAIDLPGHGISSKDVGDGSLATLASAVLAFMDAMDITCAHLIGHSLGGAVALEVARNSPERSASLALISPIGLGGRVNETFIRRFVEGQSRRDIKPVLELLVADASLVSRDMVGNVLKYKRLEGVMHALRKIADSVLRDGAQAASYRDLLARFDGAASVIWGERDAIVDRTMVQGLPERVKVHLLTNVGHMPHMEASATVNDLLAAHIQS